MPPDDTRANEATDAFWDGVVQDRAIPTSDLHLADADIIRHLHAADDVPPPRPAFTRTLREDLMHAETLPVSSTFQPDPGSFPLHLRAQLPRPGIPASPRGRGWVAAQLATAALVLLAVIGGVLALGRGLPERQADAPMLPALVIGTPASPAPGPTVVEETLLAVPLPAALLPQGDRVAAEITHLTSPPGSTGTWRAVDSADQPGLRVLFVMDGTLTLRADGPAQVMRTDGAGILEEVPAGTEVTLHTGDTWIARNETPWEAVNPSAKPAELLLWALANLDDPTAMALNRTPGTWALRNFFATPPGVTVPLAPATLRIRLVELPVKSRLAAPEDGLQYGLPVVANAEGTPVVGPSIGNLPDGRVVNIGRKPALGYVVTLESGQEREGNALATPTNAP